MLSDAQPPEVQALYQVEGECWPAKASEVLGGKHVKIVNMPAGLETDKRRPTT